MGHYQSIEYVFSLRCHKNLYILFRSLKFASNDKGTGEEMECFQAATEKHLYSMEKIKMHGAWVQHALSNNKNQRVPISSIYLVQHYSTYGRKQRFLYRIVTGDKIWYLYINMKQLKQWLSHGKQATPYLKQDLHPHKKMLWVWCDRERIIHYALFERS